MKPVRIIIFLGLLVGLIACAATESRRSTGEQFDDAAVLTRVKSALIASDETEGMDVDVEVFRGRVQLNGTASSEEHREAATRVVEDVSGVVAVENNLEVQPESRRVGQYIDDKTLEARVSTALARADDVSVLDVEVEAYEGEVSLGGFVATQAEKRRAEEVVKNVRYVRRVVNNIAVRPERAQ